MQEVSQGRDAGPAQQQQEGHEVHERLQTLLSHLLKPCRTFLHDLHATTYVRATLHVRER